MTRLLAATALLASLLAGPAWSQTMNSAPAPMQPKMAAPDRGTAPAQRGHSPAAKAHHASTSSTGSSMAATDKSSDNSADQLNREELAKLSSH
jgi:hypothetical protein